MLQLDWNIEFNNEGRKFRLALLSALEIVKSVQNLADVATIVLPEAMLNKVLEISSKIGRGTQVAIQLGYNGKLYREFDGFVQEIQTNDSTLKLICEDALFLFRKAVPNIEMKTPNVSDIANYLIQHIDPSFTLVCDFNIGYEKFVIHNANGYDILKKLADDTRCNIYFNTGKKELHIHAPYIEKAGEVKYSLDQNVETSSLEYKRAIDRKFEITVESVGSDGKIKTVKAGTTGGETVSMKVGAMNESDMKKIADAELIKRSSDRYEGSITTWLVPYVEPTYTARFHDPDYPEKDGAYYVVSVTTTLSDAGGVREVEFGIKLG